MRKRFARQQGFTLIEMIFVVLIIGVLVAIGIPAYNNHIQTTHQQRAQGELSRVMALAESFRAQNFSYNGFALPGNLASQDRYDYEITIGGNNQTIEVRALPIGQQTGVGALGINNTGETCHSPDSDEACTLGVNPW